MAATKNWTGRLPAEDENHPDTATIQAAIDTCSPGKAVELKALGGKNALLTGPLQLPGGATLLIDKGVVLVASRDPREFDLKVRERAEP